MATNICIVIFNENMLFSMKIHYFRHNEVEGNCEIVEVDEISNIFVQRERTKLR